MGFHLTSFERYRPPLRVLVSFVSEVDLPVGDERD